MKRVILESPYAGDIETNLAYARRAVKHSLSLGEAPIASHLLYTQPGILDDSIKSEREQGIKAGLDWLAVAEAVVLYLDRGLSLGINFGMSAAILNGTDIYARWIEGPVDQELLESIEQWLTGYHGYA